jgi:hypothetical protein
VPIALPVQGSLPVPNQEAVKLALRAGLALGSRIAQRSKFDRKQYFYAGVRGGGGTWGAPSKYPDVENCIEHSAAVEEESY